MKKLQPPWKKSPTLSQQPPSQNWEPVKDPLLKNLVGDLNPLPLQQKVGVHTLVPYLFKERQSEIKRCWDSV